MTDGSISSGSSSRPQWQQHRFVLISSNPILEDVFQDTRLALDSIVTSAFASDSVTVSHINLASSEGGDQFKRDLEDLKRESKLMYIPNLPALIYIPPSFEAWNKLGKSKATKLSQFHQKALGKISSSSLNTSSISSPFYKNSNDQLILQDAVKKWIHDVTKLHLQMHNDATDKYVCFFLIKSLLQEESMGCIEPVENDQQVGDPGEGKKWGDRSHWGNPIVRYLALFDKIEARDQKGKLLKSHIVLYSGLFSIQNDGFCNLLVDSCQVPKRRFPTDPAILSRREKEDQNRLAAIETQPSHRKHFTAEGFTKLKLPEDLYQAYRGFLDVNKAQLISELWTVDNVFTSQFDAPTLKLTLPETGSLKPLLFEEVQRIMEDWLDDKVKLEKVAMYGLRLYTSGTWLAMHVDRPDTHIISGIINVDQDVEEPYALQIVDHQGVEHNVTMDPGEIVLYEGATCSHGRRIPLKGKYYANLFVHFRPAEK